MRTAIAHDPAGIMAEVSFRAEATWTAKPKLDNPTRKKARYGKCPLVFELALSSLAENSDMNGLVQS